MKTKDRTLDDTALSLGERVDRCAAFTSRAGTGLRPPKGYAQSAYSIGCGPQAGEGFLPDHGGQRPAVVLWAGINPSPVALRRVQAPEDDTLSPRERAGGSREERSRNVYEKKGTTPKCAAM
jgi:hypothetical protein